MVVKIWIGWTFDTNMIRDYMGKKKYYSNHGRGVEVWCWL